MSFILSLIKTKNVNLIDKRIVSIPIFENQVKTIGLLNKNCFMIT